MASLKSENPPGLPHSSYRPCYFEVDWTRNGWDEKRQGLLVALCGVWVVAQSHLVGFLAPDTSDRCVVPGRNHHFHHRRRRLGRLSVRGTSVIGPRLLGVFDILPPYDAPFPARIFVDATTPLDVASPRPLVVRARKLSAVSSDTDPRHCRKGSILLWEQSTLLYDCCVVLMLVRS